MLDRINDAIERIILFLLGTLLMIVLLATFGIIASLIFSFLTGGLE